MHILPSLRVFPVRHKYSYTKNAPVATPSLIVYYYNNFLNGKKYSAVSENVF